MNGKLHIEDRIGELLLGDVGDDERAAMEAHALGCARCGQALAAATEAFALVGAALSPEPPPPSLRARILGDLAPRRGAVSAAFVDKLAALFDITIRRARLLLDWLDTPDAWQPGPVAGSWVAMFEEPGAKLAGAFCGFVKMNPSVRWPRHTHLGTEHMLVLAGGFKQPDGVEVHPGTVHTMLEGSAHEFDIFPDEPCIAAAVVFGGVRFDDPSFTVSGVSQ